MNSTVHCHGFDDSARSSASNTTVTDMTAQAARTCSVLVTVPPVGLGSWQTERLVSLKGSQLAVPTTLRDPTRWTHRPLPLSAGRSRP